MKSRMVTVIAGLVAIALLVSCGAVKSRLPGTSTGVKKVARDVGGAKVEVLEHKWEKIGPWDGRIEVEISGTAIYIPAKVGAKPMSDFGCPSITVDFLDGLGRKVLQNWSAGTTCGLHDLPENVVPNEPFPFSARFYIWKEDWAKITSYTLIDIGWW